MDQRAVKARREASRIGAKHRPKPSDVEWADRLHEYAAAIERGEEPTDHPMDSSR